LIVEKKKGKKRGRGQFRPAFQNGPRPLFPSSEVSLIMKKPVRIALVVIGVILGVPVGASLGFYVVRFGGPLVFGRDFFQIGWLFVMFTVPGGALLGAIAGGLTMAARPRLFALTFLPLALFFIGLQITLSSQGTSTHGVSGTSL
jgi:hypothetical protein